MRHSVVDAAFERLGRAGTSVPTGLTAAEVPVFYNIIGVVIESAGSDKRTVVLRGMGDRDNDALVAAAAKLSREMTAWLKTKDVGQSRWQGSTILLGWQNHDNPLASSIPVFGPVTAGGATLTGNITETKLSPSQGAAFWEYEKHIVAEGRGEVLALTSMGASWQ